MGRATVCRNKRPTDGTTSIHPCRYLLAEFGDHTKHDCSRNIAAVIPAASVATGTAEQAFTITPGLDRSVRVLNTPGGGRRCAGLGESSRARAKSSAMRSSRSGVAVDGASSSPCLPRMRSRWARSARTLRFMSPPCFCTYGTVHRRAGCDRPAHSRHSCASPQSRSVRGPRRSRQTARQEREPSPAWTALAGTCDGPRLRARMCGTSRRYPCPYRHRSEDADSHRPEQRDSDTHGPLDPRPTPLSVVIQLVTMITPPALRPSTSRSAVIPLANSEAITRVTAFGTGWGSAPRSRAGSSPMTKLIAATWLPLSRCSSLATAEPGKVCPRLPVDGLRPSPTAFPWACSLGTAGCAGACPPYSGRGTTPLPARGVGPPVPRPDVGGAPPGPYGGRAPRSPSPPTTPTDGETIAGASFPCHGGAWPRSRLSPPTAPLPPTNPERNKGTGRTAWVIRAYAPPRRGPHQRPRQRPDTDARPSHPPSRQPRSA